MRWRADKEGGGKVAVIGGKRCRIRQRWQGGPLFAYADGHLVGEFRSLDEAERALAAAVGKED